MGSFDKYFMSWVPRAFYPLKGEKSSLSKLGESVNLETVLPTGNYAKGSSPRSSSSVLIESRSGIL